MKEVKPNYDEGMWKGAPVSSFLKAKILRKEETASEKLLWEKLRGNQIKGYKFRRQHPVNLFIADFYCHQLKLIIEVDGEYHLSKEQAISGQERTNVLNANGLDVMRIKNEEVLNDIISVMSKILIRIGQIENSNSPNLKGS